MMDIHPDDILVFTEVTNAMRKVAAAYELPLRKITGYPMPKYGMANRMGDCSHSGDIRLVLRCTVDGQWCEEPLSPDEVWDTAAHELAHLRHMNHGAAFHEFYLEMRQALANQREDHKQKILKKLVKIQDLRQSEKDLGNEKAAENFAGMINKMLLEYELNPSDIDYARASDDDPVIEIYTDLGRYNIKESKTRVAWQETLAAAVANAHLCTILIRPGSNGIVFVGTRSHATVAEYVYGTMVPSIERMSKKAEVDYWRATGSGRGVNNKALGYRAAWIDAFIKRIWERFREARQEALAQMVAQKGVSNETGLMRLDGALIKVRKYIDDKFSNRDRRAAKIAALSHRAKNHEDGKAAGRAAADQIVLGRRGVTGTDRKRIGGE